MISYLSTLAARLIAAETAALRRRVVRSVVLGAMAAICGLFALGFLAAAAVLYLSPRLGAAGASLTVGGVFLVLALIFAIVLSIKPARRSHMAAVAEPVPPPVLPPVPPPEPPPAGTMALVLGGAVVAGFVLGRKILR